MTDLRFSLPSELNARVRAALARAEADRLVPRIWAGDASVWTGADEAHWLGWLRVIEDERERVGTYAELRDEIRAEGVTRILVVGMGGSSLAPQVLARTFGPQEGYPALEILDSTDPAQVRSAVDRDLRSTLVIVASKSGSTLEPNILKQYAFERMREAVGGPPGRRFVAITDPGSRLEVVAAREGFRRTFAGVPSVGGRFSALSSFGLVPASLAGIDVGRLLGGADRMAARCGPDRPTTENPGAVLGVILGESALAGRDKPTLVFSPDLAGLGAWLEQLLAESTGKMGKAIIPVDGETLAAPERYGNDRVFVRFRLGARPDATQDRAVEALERAGQPLVSLEVADASDLGAEFFRWEMATAVAGAVLRLNPFDQPDVESAKTITRRIAEEYETQGRLPAEAPVFRDGDVALFTDARNAAELSGKAGEPASLASWIGAHFGRLRAGDYAALLAYLPMTPEYESALQGLRHRIRDARRVATTVGFGPRYLHSTGQAHKGGPDTGLFLLLTADAPDDLPIPGQRYTFGVIEAAQAAGDFQALLGRRRRALRVHLGTDAAGGLAAIDRALAEALS